MATKPILYGIPNCDTVRKARKWLAQHDIDYGFHDLRQDGIDAARMKRWLKKAEWEILLNRRGTTWRTLPNAVKDDLDGAQAMSLMIAHPTLIKRPVLEIGAAVHVGFKADHYAELFA